MADLLGRLLSNDNQARSAAEAEFERLKVAEPNGLLKFLFHGLMGADTTSVAALPSVAMRCVLLRGMAIRDKTLFASLSPEEFSACRAQLLSAFVADSENTHIRRIMANAMAAVAGVESNWPELMTHLHMQLSSADTSPKSLQVCLFLLNKLAEHIGPLLVANFDQVMYLITASLLETSSIKAAPTDIYTRAAAALSLCSFLHELPAAALSAPASAEKVASSLLTAISVLGAAVQAGESDLGSDLLAALDLLAQQRPRVFGHAWQQLFEMLAAICTVPAESDQVDEEIKASALRLATCLLTSPVASEFCSHAESRSTFLRIAMNFVTIIDDEEGQEFFHKSDDEDGFGDAPGDESDTAQLSTAAAQCLSDMAASFDAAEVVQTCLAAAWRLVTNQDDWKMRRAALFITATICEGASSAMYAVLPQIVPQILHLATSDPHPRVQYSALHCLIEMVHEFPGEEPDVDEDEEESEAGQGCTLSFQDMFLYALPQQICVALQGSQQYPRNAASCVHLLRIFYDPGRLEGEHEILTQVMDYCLAYILAFLPQGVPKLQPLFLLHEMLLLFGNISQLMPADDLHARYEGLMNIFRGVIGSLVDPVCSVEENTLKCLALQAFALVGKAAGKERFSADAAALLNVFVFAQPALDASDPLSSYLMQSAAWMAGVIGDDFEPFVPHLIPGLIGRIGADIDIEVTAGEDLPSAGDEAAGGSKDNFSVYQRGVGNVSILCNSSQFTDKEMSCRVLYQFMLDVPALVCPYVPDVVRALVPLVDQRFVFSEECAHTIGLCMSEALAVHLAHAASEPNDAGTAAMVEFVLQALAQSMQCQRERDASMPAAKKSQLSRHRLCAAIGCMREIFVSLSDADNRRKWQLHLSHETLCACLLLLRDEMLSWMQGKLQQDEGNDAETEEEIRTNLSDALGWITRIGADARLAEVYATQVQGILNTEPFATLFMPDIDEDN